MGGAGGEGVGLNSKWGCFLLHRKKVFVLKSIHHADNQHSCRFKLGPLCALCEQQISKLIHTQMEVGPSAVRLLLPESGG